jgi:hypothetical protein
MSFRIGFQERLAELEERKPQTFPEHLLPGRCSRAAVLLLFWPGPDDAVEDEKDETNKERQSEKKRLEKK